MPATAESISQATIAARAAADRKAENIVAFDVSDRLYLTDVFVIASAPNERQVSAIADEVEKKMLEAGIKTRAREGRSLGRWVLLDFGDIVVHVQHNEERVFYALEKLWKDCPAIALPTLDPDAEQGDLRTGSTEEVGSATEVAAAPVSAGRSSS